MKSLLDAYSLKARLSPGLLLLLPPGLLIQQLAPGDPWPQTSIVGGCGAAAYLLCEIVRERGHQLQAALWAAWGGPPSCSLLRWCNATVSPAVREAWRQSLESQVGVVLPSREAERRNPSKADEEYDAAIARLIERRRAKEWELIHKENAAYGFRRNLLGLRPWGLCISAGTFLLAIVAAAIDNNEMAKVAIGGSAGALAWVLWRFIVTPEWVKTKAEAYGYRLLGSLLKGP